MVAAGNLWIVGCYVTTNRPNQETFVPRSFQDVKPNTSVSAFGDMVKIRGGGDQTEVSGQFELVSNRPAPLLITGRLSIGPELLIRMLLVGYSL